MKTAIFVLSAILVFHCTSFGQNKCINFNGSTDYVTIGDIGPRPVQGTISLWVRTNVLASWPNAFTTGPLLDCGGGNAGFRLEINSTGELNNGIGQDNANCVSFVTGHILDTHMVANRWYHLAIVWNSSLNNVKGYIDGVQVYNHVNTTWPTTFPLLKIGVGFNLSRKWNGSIDEFTIWNTALDSITLRTMRYGICNPSDPNLIAWWNFDDNTTNGENQVILNKALNTLGLYNGMTVGTSITPTFTIPTMTILPSCIYLVSPVNNATNQPTTVNFNWRKGINSITNYWFELYTDTTLAPVLRDTTLTDSIKTVTSLLNTTNYWWRVRARNSSGYSSYTQYFRFTTIAPVGISQIGNQIPKEFSLSQNYPNPFNPSTVIRFDISGTSVAQTFLSVYDILGREVARLVNDELNPGSYEVTFDASMLSSGMYFYRIETGEYSNVKKLVLLK